MKRLVLVRHAPTSATRKAAFPGDEPIADGAEDQLARLGAVLPRGGEALASPSLRCRQTAEGARFKSRVEPALAECDFGRWVGLTVAELHADSPDAVGSWMTDPDAAPHGGESLRVFAARVAGWLDAQATQDGATVAFTHGGVVKAAVIHALGAPIEAFWRVDASPFGRTELHAHDGRWTVTYVNAPLATLPPRAEARLRDAAPPGGRVPGNADRGE